MAGRPYSVPRTGKQYSDIPASVIKEATRKNIRPDVLWKKKIEQYARKLALKPVVEGAKNISSTALKKGIPGVGLATALFSSSPAGAGSDDVPKDPFSTNYRGGKVKRKRKKKKASKKKIMQGYKAGGKV